ncbi:hypothetical protein [Methylomonas rhizoryzae]|uniref:hypothetical protein n=1 Tax=Methylomonas rhizoryzae TaxID=2608981 RepID=UPI001231C576|nr:hypothetical protein [Methylomonas rhizoryzae]
MNQQTEQSQTVTQTAWLFLTVQQFASKHPAFPLGTLRHQIFHEATNGLKKSGAIIRNGRRVLIREDKYFAWLEAQNQGGK